MNHLMSGGAITLTPGQAETVLVALDDAAEARRERAAAYCHECAIHPAELCEDHETDLNRADEYDALAAQLAADTPTTVAAERPPAMSGGAMRATGRGCRSPLASLPPRRKEPTHD